MSEQFTAVKKNTIKFPVIAIVVLAVGLIFGYIIGVNSKNNAGDQQSQDQVKKLQSQIEQAKKFFPVMADMRSVSGQVQEVSGNIVKIKTTDIINPFEDLPTIREITAGEKTKIVKQELKDQAAYQKETEEYQAKVKLAQDKANPASLPLAPMPYEEKEISIQDIKQGDRISVEANENIKTKTKFEASRITLQFFAGK